MIDRSAVSKKRVLTGLKPTGSVHLGNYFGSIRQIVDLQNNQDANEVYFFVADMHALTGLHDVNEWEGRAMQVNHVEHLLCASVALGVDPERSIVYRQSDFPQIFELSWIFSCMLRSQFLSIGHAYKSVVERDMLNLGLGVFLYPVLMAADILIADADVVPVGKDQIQHVEIAREIARKFNTCSGEKAYFKEPKEIVKDSSAVIPGTDGEKMSKSKGNILPIFDDEEEIRRNIMSIVTSSAPKGVPIDPSACLVCTYLEKMLPRSEYAAVVARCTAGNTSYRELKELLFEKFLSYFADARDTYARISQDRGYVERVFSDGKQRVDSFFTERLHEARRLLGVL